jgi:hypothetical protein
MQETTQVEHQKDFKTWLNIQSFLLLSYILGCFPLRGAFSLAQCLQETIQVEHQKDFKTGLNAEKLFFVVKLYVGMISSEMRN